MAELVTSDASLWLGELALRSKLNGMGLSLGPDLKDTTTYGDTYRRRLAGLKAFGVQMSGFWDVDADAVLLNTDLALNDVAVTISPLSTVGAVAYVGLADLADYSMGGQIGDVFAFNAGAQGSSLLGRGLLMHNSVLSATANGTGQQLGALSDSQKMLCAVHVPLVAGSTPSLTVTVQSDDNAGFSSPTTRATFGAITAAGWAYTTISGAISDDYWRYAFAISGTTPSFTIASSMARASSN